MKYCFFFINHVLTKMPRNIKGGKGHKRGANHNDGDKKELPTKTQGQDYAQVLKMLGNGRVTVFCFDGRERLGIIRGSMRKRSWIYVGDIVLIGSREFQDEKVDILHKYSPSDTLKLKKMGHLPSSITVEENSKNDDLFNFEEISEEDDLQKPLRNLPKSDDSSLDTISTDEIDLSKL